MSIGDLMEDTMARNGSDRILDGHDAFKRGHEESEDVGI